MPEPQEFTGDSQEVFNTGVASMSGEQQETMNQTANASPLIGVMPDGAIKFAGFGYPNEYVQHLMSDIEQDRSSLNITRAKSCWRRVALWHAYNPDNANASKEQIAKAIRRDCQIDGFAQLLYAGAENPEEAMAQDIDRVIGDTLANTPKELAGIAQAAMETYDQNASLAKQFKARWDRDADTLEIIAPMTDDKGNPLDADGNVIDWDDEDAEQGTDTKDPRYIEEQAKQERRNKALKEELLLRMSDAISVYRQENPDATKAELYGVARQCAADNFRQVEDAIDSGEDYLVQFAEKRDKMQLTRAQDNFRKYQDSMQDINKARKQGAPIAQVEATQKAINDTRQAWLTEQARKNEKNAMEQQYPNAVPGSTSSKSSKRKFSERTSYTVPCGRSSLYDSPDDGNVLILPEADYNQLVQDFGVKRGQAVFVHLGSGKNLKKAEVRPGKVSKPGMNNALFHDVYIAGKRQEPSFEQQKIYATSYRQSLYFFTEGEPDSDK